MSFGARSFATVARKIREASRCKRCGKPRIAVNVAGHRARFRAETVRLESHCQCPETPLVSPSDDHTDDHTEGLTHTDEG